eukprot:1036180_1
MMTLSLKSIETCPSISFSCPGRHVLLRHPTTVPNYTFKCNFCNSNISNTQDLYIYGCRECDYDICLTCIDRVQNPQIPQFGHETIQLNPTFYLTNIANLLYTVLSQIEGISSFQDTLTRNNSIHVLLSILSNILQNPSDKKYQNLNFTKLKKKLNTFPTLLNMLFALGFDQLMEDNKSRLKMIGFDSNNIDLIFMAHNKLNNILWLSEHRSVDINMQNNCLLFIVYAFIRDMYRSSSETARIYSDVIHMIYANIGVHSTKSNLLIVENGQTLALGKQNMIPNTNICEFESIWILENGKLVVTENNTVIRCYNNLIMENNAQICGTQAISYYCEKQNCPKLHQGGATFSVQVFGQIILKSNACIKSNGLDPWNRFSVDGNGGCINIEANNIVMDGSNYIEAVGGRDQLNGKITIMMPKYRFENLVFQNVSPKPSLL